MSILFFAVVVVIVLVLIFYGIDVARIGEPFAGLLKLLAILLGVVAILNRAGIV